MATPSVDVSSRPEDEPAPAMLDRARGLASAIGAAAAAAVAEQRALRSVRETRSMAATAATSKLLTPSNHHHHPDGGIALQLQEDVEMRDSDGDARVAGTAASGNGSQGGGVPGHLPGDVVGRQVRVGPSPAHHPGPKRAGPAAPGPSSYHHRRTQSGRIAKPGSSLPHASHSASLSLASAIANPASLAKAASVIAEITTAAAAAAAVVAPVSAAASTYASASVSGRLGSTFPFPSAAVAPAISTSDSAAPAMAPSQTRDASTAAATTTTTTTKLPDAPVLSFWGPEPVPLPSRFVRIKRNLIRGHETELAASWARLLAALRDEVDHIQSLGAGLIPSIDFSSIDDPEKTAQFGRDLRRYGVGVVRKVLPKSEADASVRDTMEYLDTKRQIKSIQQHDPSCFDYFWTPAQVRSRAHPNVLSAQRFMMGLWETSPDNRLVTRLPITYVDRIRIHGTDERQGPDTDAPPPENLQSADDWINALASSAGIIAQVDNGSLERWEPDGYQRAGTYNHVFGGHWEDHDPWECATRVSTTSDLYNGHGACTIFRMFQGILALSTVEPGILRLLPSPKLATAYYLLRPFFSTIKPPPASRSGPEWDAYLDPANWKLEREPDTVIHGAVPGHAQRITERWHPHLHLRSSMITLPTLQPGDYIFWHPDLPYHLSSNNPGLATPNPRGAEPSMLVYIPAAPLTQTNALYLARQRKAFQRGHPGPDFDSTGRGTIAENPETRPGEKEIADAGGPAALQAMGLAPWEVAGTRAGTPPSDRDPSKDEGPETEKDNDIRSLRSSSSNSNAEAEVVRLANIILFPDRSMMGYSV